MSKSNFIAWLKTDQTKSAGARPFTRATNKKIATEGFHYVFGERLPGTSRYKIQDQSVFANFMGFPRKNHLKRDVPIYILGGFIILPLKNILKLVVEYLPLLIEHYSIWGIGKLKNSLKQIRNSKHPSYIKNPFLRGTAAIGIRIAIVALNIPRYLSKVIRVVARLVTSPICSAQEGADLHPALGVLSVIGSVVAYAGLAIVAAPAVVALTALVAGSAAAATVATALSLPLLAIGLPIAKFFGFATTVSLGPLILNTASAIGAGLIGALTSVLGIGTSALVDRKTNNEYKNKPISKVITLDKHPPPNVEPKPATYASQTLDLMKTFEKSGNNLSVSGQSKDPIKEFVKNRGLILKFYPLSLLTKEDYENLKQQPHENIPKRDIASIFPEKNSSVVGDVIINQNNYLQQINYKNNNPNFEESNSKPDGSKYKIVNLSGFNNENLDTIEVYEFDTRKDMDNFLSELHLKRSPQPNVTENKNTLYSKAVDIKKENNLSKTDDKPTDEKKPEY